MDEEKNTNASEETHTESDGGTKEYFRMEGDEVLKKVKEIIAEGNARRIILQNEKGESVLEIPLTFAAVGAVFLPVLAAVGAIAAVLTKCTIVVVKKAGK